MVYLLNLTEEELATITFIGYRYNWGRALNSFFPGNNFLTNDEARRVAESFEADVREENRPLPLLSTESKLYCKLMDFWKSIV